MNRILPLLLLIMTLAAGCASKAYNGYVYDYKTKLPLENVEVADYLNNANTKTDAKGYFNLKHESKIASKLVFKKQGYASDTIDAIDIQNGEKMTEKFKGDTIYLFNANNTFRDSIARLNTIKE